MTLDTLRPVCVLMLRSPVPVSQGTDSYHDAFGAFCLPSFANSAIESGFSTPLTPLRNGADEQLTDSEIRAAIGKSLSMRQTRRFFGDDAWLMTHHKPNAERDFCVTSFPILGHKTLNVELLAEKIRRIFSGEEHYDGVIITSQRAVQAWTEACIDSVEHLRNATKPPDAPWSKLTYYAVGPATATALREIDVPHFLVPKHVCGGAETGSGEALANLIADKTGAGSKRYLYLVGDKRSPALQNTLAARNPDVHLDTLQTYETCKDADFEMHCSSLARNLPQYSVQRRPSRSGESARRLAITALESPAQHHGEDAYDQEHGNDPRPSAASRRSSSVSSDTMLFASQDHPDWIIFFSPSSAEYALPELRARNWICTDAQHDAHAAKIACIGPTTAQWVRSTLAREPDAVAARPTATALRDAVVDAVGSK